VSLRRGQVHLAKKDLERAAEELKKAKGIKKGSPLFAVYQIAMARLEAASGSLEKAIARLEEVCKLQKGSWECHFALATLYEAQDQPQKAIASYATVIELDPKKDPTGAIYAYQRWAALSLASDPNSYSNKNLMAKAKERYKTFLERAPKNDVPAALIEATRQMMGVFDYIG
jgi:tetratricopeptide (TPR) repeat protein